MRKVILLKDIKKNRVENLERNNSNIGKDDVLFENMGGGKITKGSKVSSWCPSSCWTIGCWPFGSRARGRRSLPRR